MEQRNNEEGGPKVATETETTFPVSVNYALTIEEMVERGKYDCVDQDVTQEHFPHDTSAGVHEVEFLLACLNDEWENTENIPGGLKKRGYRSASAAELLAFGEAFPEEQRRCSIVAFGSSWRHSGGYRHVVCLGGDADERDCSLCSVGFFLSNLCLLLVVRLPVEVEVEVNV